MGRYCAALVGVPELELAVAAVPIDQGWFIGPGYAAGLDPAHVDRMRAGRIAILDGAIKPDQGVGQDGRICDCRRPIPFEETILVFDPGETIGKPDLSLMADFVFSPVTTPFVPGSTLEHPFPERDCVCLYPSQAVLPRPCATWRPGGAAQNSVPL